MIRVLIVDDSAFMRKALSLLLEGDAEINVIDTAHDGLEAIEKVEALHPDIVTMDVEMPRMDGLTALRHIMATRPTPVVMVSSLTQESARTTVEALQAGAADFIPKQSSYASLEIAQFKETLIQRIKSIARSQSQLFRRPGAASTSRSPAASRPIPSAAAASVASVPHLRCSSAKLLVIGVSTGGPFALQQVLSHLPADLPVPVVVVQHMPPHFTRSLAKRLNALSPLTVVEAADGMPVQPGTVFIAPGGRHLTFRPAPRGPTILISDEPATSLHRPSVDVTFRSAHHLYGGRLLAVVMTGMGKDGLLACREIKQSGGSIIAQDEETSVVYGMPRAVVEAGLADAVLPLEAIAPAVILALHPPPFPDPSRESRPHPGRPGRWLKLSRAPSIPSVHHEVSHYGLFFHHSPPTDTDAPPGQSVVANALCPAAWHDGRLYVCAVFLLRAVCHGTDRA